MSGLAELQKAYWCAVIDAAVALDGTDELSAAIVTQSAMGHVEIPEGATRADAERALHRIAAAYLDYQFGGA
jgi:hypothetical protein